MSILTTMLFGILWYLVGLLICTVIFFVVEFLQWRDYDHHLGRPFIIELDASVFVFLLIMSTLGPFIPVIALGIWIATIVEAIFGDKTIFKVEIVKGDKSVEHPMDTL